MLDIKMKIIFELTLAEREFYLNGDSVSGKFMKLIHIVSSMALSGNSEDEILQLIKIFFRKDLLDEKIYDSFITRVGFHQGLESAN